MVPDMVSDNSGQNLADTAVAAAIVPGFHQMVVAVGYSNHLTHLVHLALVQVLPESSCSEIVEEVVAA